MADDNSDSKVTLSRRKALAGIGSIGLAGALGVGGTYAQFSDNEERAITFTAGGIDGEISLNSSYNGEHVTEDTPFVSLEETGVTAYGYMGREVTVDIHFDDVKPGDFGCFNFSISVSDNAAWVASKLKVLDNTDYKNFEPEIAADGDVSEENVDDDGELTSPVDIQSDTPGELAQNIYTIPYYDGDGTCTFFDSETDEFDASSYDGATPGQFWSNSQPGSNSDFSTQDVPGSYSEIGDGETYLAPRSLTDVSQNVNAIGTALWNSDGMSIGYYTAPNGSTIAKGSMMLDGSVATEGDSGNNTQSVAPLQPGSTLNFGYDWHMPFGVGNEAQGDRASIQISFLFLQSRHTEAPDFGSYDPGQNTPNSS